MLKLILEYSKLAAALDTTRHHMSVNGVSMPDNHGMATYKQFVNIYFSSKRLKSMCR